jgi:arylsulfatase A-like enzyme
VRLGWAAITAILSVSVVAPQQPGRPNVMLITVDALRADRLRPDLMPTLTDLASRGVRFERVYAHAPTTLPSHASVLTGLLPPSHGVRNDAFRLDDTVVTLAELLQASGYRTGAFVGSSLLDVRYGLDQGFDEYDDRYESSATGHLGLDERHAADVLSAAASWIAGQREPWFSWIHLADPHAPYEAPARRRQGYDGEVAYVDEAIGRFLSALPRGLIDRVVVIVTADHGESLGDHGERTHGLFAYDATLRVPLVIAGPGIAPRVVAGLASHVDVMPTILALTGAASRASDGRSLVPLLKGEQLPDRPVYFEALDASLTRGWAPLTGVVAEGWKFIDLPMPELYDLATDRLERTNRLDGNQQRSVRMRDLTMRLRTSAPRADGAGPLAEPEARARLRSLGYVGSASWRLGAWRVEDDPKRLLDLHLRFERARDLAARDPQAAIAKLRSLTARRPDFAAAYDLAGALLVATGRPREAVALVGEARSGGLRHRMLAERLAEALIAAGDPDSAIDVLVPVVESDDHAVSARYTLARAYARVGDDASARQHLVAVLRIDPTFPAASALLESLRP